MAAHTDATNRDPLVLDHAAPDALARAAAVLAQGGVIAFPTDTVYGIGAALDQPAALHRIFTVKGRPEEKPLPVLLASVAALATVAADLDPRIARFAEQFWPGALTVVVPARPGLPAEVLGPGHTVGVRVPAHALARALIERAAGALATTSANLSGRPPARTAADVSHHLGSRLNLILDGGAAPGGVPSTVIAFDRDRLTILREGAISTAQLRQEWENVAGRR